MSLHDLRHDEMLHDIPIQVSHISLSEMQMLAEFAILDSIGGNVVTLLLTVP
jgi:hypothetical protein